MGNTTKELPLSARVIIVLLSLSLVLMDFICVASGCNVLRFCSVVMCVCDQLPFSGRLPVHCK